MGGSAGISSWVSEYSSSFTCACEKGVRNAPIAANRTKDVNRAKNRGLLFIQMKVASFFMMLKAIEVVGSVRLKKNKGRYWDEGCPWVYSNELTRIDTKIPVGSWVYLEDAAGKVVSLGHFNPHSLIAYREFYKGQPSSDAAVQAHFTQLCDRALALRMQAYGVAMASGKMGARSFRLLFGESDGLPGLVVDLFEPGVFVAQCHSAGADQFLPWLKEWMGSKLGVNAGLIRNDVEVRKRENAPQFVEEWGALPSECFALEGGVRFSVDVKKGQKTGFFYDHRDNRWALVQKVLGMAAKNSGAEILVLDCFSYVGSWGLQLAKALPRVKLLAVDVSAQALAAVSQNAKANGVAGQVEILELDLFKDAKGLGKRKFDVVISDPPSLTSSAKHRAQGYKAHQACFATAVRSMRAGGVAAFASCSFHLDWESFLQCSAAAALEGGSEALRFTFFGSQSADHPVLSSLPETRYLKCVFGE